ncbi:TonB-dependent receptor [uncultured Pseudacidovorax sp.]|uniref:TonB-dependent receptor n=1 Tax=uncultured Pseudacidovorax sp. TaxID=679313 RepID=UPI0025E67144|nr:TonB-dependent receptor [uncultured Pseudacidovorax sp.]
MNPQFHRHAIGAAVLFALSTLAHAQSAADGATLNTITITGNPLGAADAIAPVEALSGNALLYRSQSTLGETLQGLPGVSSTYFGPNASRPTIRGQDGDRIRILSNGGASVDASALSYDHAVPTDALVTDRIEVLRGPGALLYGGSAVGGVVNVIDNRIPTEPIDGFGGRVDASYASGSKEGSGAVVLEGGNDRFALHVDAFRRHADDVNAPTWLECSKGGVNVLQKRICNSASESRGGAVGGTLFFGGAGWIGASVSDYRSNYGTVAEDDVTIGMRQQRQAIEGEWRPGGFFTRIHAKASHTDYRHTEYEGGSPGTTLKNNGNDLRIEARHRAVAGFEGLIGLQSERTRFAADGEEAFAPHSRTRSDALFLYEELPLSWGKLSFGARTERVKVSSQGYPDDPSITRFALGERSFNPHSASFGLLYNVAPQWQITGNLAYTERAPKDYELFANGPHVATAAWEVGDTGLQKERSLGADIGAQWKSGPHNARVNAYWSKFRNYIGLTATGNLRTGEGESFARGSDEAALAAALDEELLAEYVYRGVRARFTGIEASGSLRLLGSDGVRPQAGGNLDLEWRADAVRATNTDTDEALPRIAPVRVGATLAWTSGPWSARVGFDHYAAQKRVPATDRAADSYTLWNASLGYRMKVQRASLLWYARVDNLGNELAYSATSILTTTVYPRAPLPGRSVKVGLRVDF